MTDQLNPTSEQERLHVKLKEDLQREIVKLIKAKKLTRLQLMDLLDIPGSRISELIQGKVYLMGVPKLLYYAHLLGAHVEVRVRAGKGSRS